jgi:hypothetical protein
MSYDLTIAAVGEGEDLQAAYARVMEADEEDDGGAPVAELQIDVKVVAAAITAVAPMLVDGGGGGIGNEIELNEEPEPRLGLQVTVRGDQVWVTVPYWHRGDAARRVFEVIRRVCDAVERLEKGMRTFDGQLGRVVEWGRDEREMVRVYEPISGRMEELGRDAVRRTGKRWWEFWK